jgi:nucleoside-diphosphate-sugar epimerase
MDRINVVVGNGFLGAAIADELGLNHPTVMLGRSPSKAVTSAKSSTSLDFAASLGGLGAINTLFWAAGPSSPFKIEQQPNLALEHISYVTKILSKVEADKIIYCSSGGTIYGNLAFRQAANESHLLNPISVYGKMHMRIENSLLTLPNVTCLRFGNLYGIRQKAQLQQGLIAHAIRSAQLNVPLDVYGTGNETRDYISIESAAKQAVELSQLTSPNVLNLGTGVSTSTNEVIDVISELVDVKIETRYHPRRTFDVEHSLLDISRLNTLISTGVKPIADEISRLLVSSG